MNVREQTNELLTSIFKPKSDISTSDWCEKNVILSRRISQWPGPYSISAVPYVKSIYDAYDDSSVKTIVLCWAARSSKTETMFNILRHNIAVDHEPFIYACPSGNLARDWSETRIRPSLIDCEATAAEIPDNSDLFKLTAMHFKHCSGWIIGAGSAANLAGRSCRLLLCDECDKWPESGNKETGAIQNLTERNRERWNRKTIISSTPTTENGQIWQEFQSTDQRYYFCPCPHCKFYQTLKKTNLKHSELARNKDGSWDMQKVMDTTYLECENCHKEIYNNDKQEMLTKGEWRATTITKEPGKIGFHLNVLYSPWTSWPDIQVQFLKSTMAGREELQKFINSWLAEPFYSLGDPKDFMILLDKARHSEPVDGIPLDNAAVMAIDVQQTSLYFEVCAFDKNRHCLVLDYGQVPDWPEMDTVLNKWKPFGVCIDSAYAARQSEVLNWAYNKRQSGVLAVPVLGSAGLLDTYRWQKVPIAGGMFAGKEVETLRFRPDNYKDEWLLRVTNTGLEEEKRDKGIPLWLAPSNATDEWKKHHSSEAPKTKKLGHGKKQVVWELQNSRRANHWFDCYDKETQVLTKYEGFKYFKDLTGNEELGTINLTTDEIEYQLPTTLIDKPYSGSILLIGGDKHSRVDMCVTPEHRMVIYAGQTSRTPSIKLAKEVTKYDRIKKTGKWKGKSDKYFIVPKCKNYPEQKIPIKLMAQFYGWYVSEGYCTGKNVVGISQTIPENREKIDKLLKQLPWTYHWTNTEAIFSNQQLFNLVESLGNTYNKRAPQWVKDSSIDIILEFLEAAVDGDGWRQHKHETYCSVSKLLAEDMAECWLKCGYSVSIDEINSKEYKIRGKVGMSIKQYHVHRNHIKWALLRDSKQNPIFKTIQYKGNVYCATVPNGTLIIKRNKKISICGNCSVYCLMFFEALRPIIFDIPQVNRPPKSPIPEVVKCKELMEMNNSRYDREEEEDSRNNPWGYRH